MIYVSVRICFMHCERYLWCHYFVASTAVRLFLEQWTAFSSNSVTWQAVHCQVKKDYQKLLEIKITMQTNMSYRHITIIDFKPLKSACPLFRKILIIVDTLLLVEREKSSTVCLYRKMINFDVNLGNIYLPAMVYFSTACLKCLIFYKTFVLIYIKNFIKQMYQAVC